METQHYSSYEEFAQAHNEDWLEEHLCWVKPNATHDAFGINEAMPDNEAAWLRDAGENLEKVLTEKFGRVTCVQIEGGHTGREEDTIWYYIN